jgi:hypothetical protein
MDQTYYAILEALSAFWQRALEADTDVRQLEGWSSLKQLEQILWVEQAMRVRYRIADFPELISARAFTERISSAEPLLL